RDVDAELLHQSRGTQPFAGPQTAARARKTRVAQSFRTRALTSEPREMRGIGIAFSGLHATDGGAGQCPTQELQIRAKKCDGRPIASARKRRKSCARLATKGDDVKNRAADRAEEMARAADAAASELEKSGDGA